MRATELTTGWILVTRSNDTPSAPPTTRIGVIDAARAVALIAMATYHFGWDLEFFGYMEPGFASHGWMKLYARSIAGSFLFLVGVSLVLAHFPTIRWRSFWKREAMVVSAALLITVATYFATPEAFIFFGILHSIALCSLIGLAFLRLPFVITLMVGVIALILPSYARSELFDVSYLSWVGLSVLPPRSNDYVPLLPWFGMVALGIAFGRVMIATRLKEWLAAIPQAARPFRFIGRHSLAFYLLHQPILFSLVYLVAMVAPPTPLTPQQAYLANCKPSCVAEGNDQTFCEQFCDCTLDRLQSEQLLTPLQSGAILPSNDDRILRLARECSATSFPGANP